MSQPSDQAKVEFTGQIEHAIYRYSSGVVQYRLMRLPDGQLRLQRGVGWIEKDGLRHVPDGTDWSTLETVDWPGDD